MKQGNQLKKMVAALALGGLMLVAPQLANADIASDIAAGKSSVVVAQQAVKGGMDPVAAAVAAAKADPAAAADIAVALSQAQPKQATAIVQALSQLYPDQSQNIAAMVFRNICTDKLYVKKYDYEDTCASLSATTPGLEGYEGPGSAAPATALSLPSSVMQGGTGISGSPVTDAKTASGK